MQPGSKTEALSRLCILLLWLPPNLQGEVAFRVCSNYLLLRWDGWDGWSCSVTSLSVRLLHSASLDFLIVWRQASPRASIPRELGTASYALALEISECQSYPIN